MPFFLAKPGGGVKRKKFIKKGKSVEDVSGDPKKAKKGAMPRKNMSNTNEDDEITSDSDSSGAEDRKVAEVNDEDMETAQEKRLRLAKQYLEEVERQEMEKADLQSIDHDALAHRLKEDLMEQSGRLQKKIADSCQPQLSAIRQLKGHKLSPTCLIISPDDKYIYSGSKDGAIIKWCLESGRRIAVVSGVDKKDKSAKIGHRGQIMCLGISSDNKFLVSGGADKIIRVWNPETVTEIHQFPGHRDAVSGLVFQKRTHQLFSCSHDHLVKVWNLDEMVYVETLFGHQDAVTGIDALMRERALTCGGSDSSLRIWKIAEESQLIFNRPAGSIDNVRLVNEDHFVSSDDLGNVSIWYISRKKPLYTISRAHGIDPSNNVANWISSLGALPYTDLVASGSRDGEIRLWKCAERCVSLSPLATIPVCGFVNAIQFSSDGKFLVAGVGQEHRLGRWWRLKEAKNSLIIVPISTGDAEATASEIEPAPNVT